MLQRLKKWWTPLHGGPEFDRMRHTKTDLDSAFLECFVPPCYYHRHQLPPGPTRVIPASLQDDAFDQAPKGRTGHLSYSIDAGEWNYWGPRRHHIYTGEPYGVIGGSWNIERVKQSIELPLHDPQALQRYLEDDYDIYLNSEGGPNWKTREHITKSYRGRHTEVLIDSIERSIEKAIANCVLKPPKDYQITTHLPVPWLRYTWRPRWDSQDGIDAVFYTIVLDQRHLLTVSFSVIRDLSEHTDKWLPQALVDIDRVMTGTRLMFKELGAAATDGNAVP